MPSSTTTTSSSPTEGGKAATSTGADATKRDEARSLEKITDYIEEIEGRKSVDTKVIEQKLKELKAKKEATNRARQERERALMKVKISKDDVEVLVKAFDCCPKLTDETASMILREQDGNLEKALKYVVIHQLQPTTTATTN
ncbi:hypothetical protein FOZ62_029977 [Perkinsus olseni]|uniref:Nascent polypeptide-associated complex subunit alpha-like UBA domain-containing protein n=1 Tax=Perkinsus olseni TaxID=32597 RepID=A0A7J6Q5Z4_PEROL|nr:hypothetical protein FOZ62_029977 [Perkinsus olseni]